MSHPYRDPAPPAAPRGGWFGRWMCRRGWHAMRHVRDTGEKDRFYSRDIVVMEPNGNRYWALVLVIGTLERCARCDHEKEGERFVDTHRGKEVYINVD